MMEKMLRGLKSLFVAGGKAGTSRQRGRQNKIGNMLFGSYYLQAFLFNLAAGVLSFVWTIIEQGGLFSLAGDFNSQQITFAMAANDAVKAGNIIWDWSLDLGSNFIGGQMFYVVGNPSFWISLLFPSRYFMYVVGWIYILKYAVAGLTSYACMRRYVRDQQTAVIGSMLYAFCGFMGEDLLFYHFHDVVALFPLLVLTLDGMMLEKKKGPFIFAVCINALVNYFFFIGEVIFMAAYYVIRYLLPGFRRYIKRLPQIILEGALGCMLGAVLLLPAFYFVIQNPRVGVDYTGSTALVFGAERYLYILKGLIFPGEVMSHQSAVIKNNFSSCNAWIPVTGLVLVIAFVTQNRKHWITKMLIFCLIMAVIPIFNASFSLFAGLYCRWYYMADYIMVLASVMTLDRWVSDKRRWSGRTPSDRAITKGAVIWGAIQIAFILFLTLVKWNNSEPSKIYRPGLFAYWSVIALFGTLLTWLILTVMKREQKLVLAAAVFVVSVIVTISDIYLLQLAHREDARHIYDRLMTTADIEYTTPEYRFTSRDNIETLSHGYPASANFCSTVSGSIFRFYESLGLKRDVKSPEAPDGMMNLISARFSIETKPREDEEPVQVVTGTYTTYYVYEDRTVPPMGFTYNTYMTASDFASTFEDDRAILMLKTLIVPDDMEDEVSMYLKPYDQFIDGPAIKEYISDISRDHLAECAYDVSQTTDSYEASIDADADKYAFFSIPNDSGWKASVDGEETPIVDINGFMAVKIHQGTNRIRFEYTVPGLMSGRIISAAGAALTAAYILLTRRHRRAER